MALKKISEPKSTLEEKTTKSAEETVAVKAEEKAPAKKKPAAKTSKPAAKPAAKKEFVFVQFDGREHDIDTITELAKIDFKANNKGAIRKIEIYIKPEDGAAYYVVNGKVSGKIVLD